MIMLKMKNTKVILSKVFGKGHKWNVRLFIVQITLNWINTINLDGIWLFPSVSFWFQMELIWIVFKTSLQRNMKLTLLQ